MPRSAARRRCFRYWSRVNVALLPLRADPCSLPGLPGGGEGRGLISFLLPPGSSRRAGRAQMAIASTYQPSKAGECCTETDLTRGREGSWAQAADLIARSRTSKVRDSRDVLCVRQLLGQAKRELTPVSIYASVHSPCIRSGALHLPRQRARAPREAPRRTHQTSRPPRPPRGSSSSSDFRSSRRDDRDRTPPQCRESLLVIGPGSMITPVSSHSVVYKVWGSTSNHREADRDIESLERERERVERG